MEDWHRLLAAILTLWILTQCQPGQVRNRKPGRSTNSKTLRSEPAVRKAPRSRLLAGLARSPPQAEPAKVPRRRYRTYADARQALDRQRTRLFNLYRKAASRGERVRVVRRAGEILTDEIDQGLFPFWYGTSWKSSGTTRVPGTGFISCGYFVSTVLKHAGFKVHRVLLGQQPSMYIIRSLTRWPFVKATSGLSIHRFVALVKRMGQGLYVVGLDIHTGFLVAKNGKVYFVHASYGTPPVVVKEDAFQSPILVQSRYRIVGRISADPRLIIKWFYRSRFVTKRFKRRRR